MSLYRRHPNLHLQHCHDDHGQHKRFIRGTSNLGLGNGLLMTFSQLYIQVYPKELDIR